MNNLYFVVLNLGLLDDGILIRIVVVYCQIIMEMIQVPDWAFEAASTAQNATFHPGLYLTEAQVILYYTSSQP